MKKNIIFLAIISVFVAQMQAQEEIIYEIPRLHIGIEAGVNPLFGTINPQPNIRENQYYYYNGDNYYDGGFMYSQYQDLSLFSFGIKPQYLISKRIALATGLRFNFAKAILYSDRDFFLWRLTETETSVNYVRIKSISQRNYYLEVPLEVRLFPREKDYIARHYFVFGASFNFLVASTGEVQFENSFMQKHQPEVLQYIGPPNIFQGTLFAGIGLKFGRMKYPFGNIEIHIPTFTFGRARNNSFTETVNVVGISFFTTLNIPVNRKHQLTYTVID